MEAKVDVRKLQILNDRINQTIDALNQVRLSVHGLGHSGLSQGMNPLTQGIGQQSFGQFGQSPFGGQQSFGPFGQQPFGFQQLPYGVPQFGFQHNPYQQFVNPFTNPLFSQGQSSPWGQVGSPWGYNQGVSGLSSLYGGGLSHTSPELKYMERQLAEVRANDPFRIAQTFPFVIG